MFLYERMGAGRMWLRFFKCMLPRRRRDGHKSDWYLADFILKYPQVVESCTVIEKLCPLHAEDIARMYINHICMAAHDENWWAENADYASQSWFLWQYLCEHKLIEPEEVYDKPHEYWILAPQGKQQEHTVTLKIERNLNDPVHGLVYIGCIPNPQLDGLMRNMRFKSISGGYLRRADECTGPVSERAVEAGVTLLEAGYKVAVQEIGLHQRIVKGTFEPEHRHWIRAAKSPEWLQLVYPYDVPLHRYLHQMGGRWTGKQMLLHISGTDRLNDVIRLYDFRVTEKASEHIAAWEKATEQATIYRKRKSKNDLEQTTTMDRFHELLNQPADVPEDLIDLND